MASARSVRDLVSLRFDENALGLTMLSNVGVTDRPTELHDAGIGNIVVHGVPTERADPTLPRRNLAPIMRFAIETEDNRRAAEAIEDQTRRLIYKAAGHWGSRQYDWCQNKQRGIAI